MGVFSIYEKFLKNFLPDPNIWHLPYGIRVKGNKDLHSNLLVGKEVNSMEQSSSYDEETVRHQFDRKCKLALQGEKVDYYRHMDYLRQHEVMLSELAVQEMDSLSTVDEYDEDICRFQALGYDIKVKDILLAEALEALTERKRNVILLSYFQDMSDAEIAKKLNLDRSTVYEHRKRSLELLKQMMEECTDENKEQKSKR